MDTKQSTKVVHVNGLPFRFSRLLARRAARGVFRLNALLGPGAFTLMSGADLTTEDGRKVNAELLTTAGGLGALARTVLSLAYRGKGLHDPDVFEDTFDELLHYANGQGAQVSPDEGKSWLDVGSLGALDAWDPMDEKGVGLLFLRFVEFQYLPTSPALATRHATAQAGATTAKASDRPGVNSGPQTSAPNGLVSG